MIPLSDEVLSKLQSSAPMAAKEILHHREHVMRLQAANTALVEENRALRAKQGILTLRWKRIGAHNLPVPARAHDGDAGLDLAVIVDEKTQTEGSWSRALGPVPKIEVYDDQSPIVFRTGWAIEIPPGWFGLVAPRSSIGKAGWDIESSGVIDSGYRGEIMLPMVYRGEGSFRVEHGQRMAQLLILPVPRIESVVVDELSESARGANGFGSTGAL